MNIIKPTTEAAIKGLEEDIKALHVEKDCYNKNMESTNSLIAKKELELQNYKFTQVQEAFNRGEVIECYNVIAEKWRVITDPSWDGKIENYRIAKTKEESITLCHIVLDRFIRVKYTRNSTGELTMTLLDNLCYELT
jgi:hypothetical protein